MDMTKIKVLVVDDHTLFRRGIADVLASQENLEVVGEAVDGLEALELAKQVIPDVVLMDLNMPNCSGLEAIQALQTEMPQINILVLTVSETETDLFAAMKFGAHGYLLKQAEPEELVHAIFHIARGGVIVSPLMATKLLGEFRGVVVGLEDKRLQNVDADLSPREGEVLRLVAQRATNKEIADRLYVSRRTVQAHLGHIFRKMGVASRTEAIMQALRKRWFTLDEIE